ncbi:dicarboxylate/amino acid:cation symporter [Caulobacter mirabilis]|nr:dicarboxylate/amino acid:cation symporter [Caulobacter mirabilis]
MTVDASPQKKGPAARLAGLWFGVPLWQRIMGALVLGAIAGFALGDQTAVIKPIGDVFVRLIRMLVAPLVFVIIASGVAQLGDPKRLGRIGVKTVGMYIVTMLIAVAVGLTLATLIQPGLGAAVAGAAPEALAAAKSPTELFLSIIPLNPIKALAEGETLAILFFAILVGVATIIAGEDGKPLARGLASASSVMLKIVALVMELAPFGVFALIAVVIGANGAKTFVHVFNLALCVILGALIQTIITHGLIVRLLARLPVIPFFRGSADAIMVGFSTASSSATLPVAIRVAEQNLGVKPPVASTVLPLGASIGMDGTAMYVGMLTVFAAQAFGVPMTLADYAIVLIITPLLAIGGGPVPSGSLFVLAAVLGAIGIGAEQTALLVGFILPFDRILDMIRTVPNVTCDLSVSTAIARWEGELDVEEFKSAKDV